MASTPTREHAEGMLSAIKNTHECTVACTGHVTLGDGKVVALVCPWERIDLDNPSDRRIVQGVYASEARAAMRSQS